MIRSLLALLTLSAALLNAQAASSDEPFTQQTAISLSRGLAQDVRAGNIERATIEAIQMEIVVMGLSRLAEMSAGTSSAAESQSVAGQLGDLRDKFMKVDKAKAVGRLPNDPVAAALLVPLADDLELAAQTGDLNAERDGAAQFRNAIFKLAGEQSQKRLAAERENLSGEARDYAELRGRMREALTTGDVQTAEMLAPKVLQQVESGILQRQFLGADIYTAYDALGRGAFQKGDYDGATGFLLEAAAKTTGSPSLDTFGPNMTLAKWLLDKGYTDAVIQFLTTCKLFWKSPDPDRWITQIKAGHKPTFLPNIHYPS